jgi:hypothetical protein
LLTTLHAEPVVVVGLLLGSTYSVPSGQTIFFTPPSGAWMVQLVAPPSSLGALVMGTDVPSSQDRMDAPVLSVLTMQDLPFLPSEPEQAARQSARPAEIRGLTKDRRFMFLSLGEAVAVEKVARDRESCNE